MQLLGRFFPHVHSVKWSTEQGLNRDTLRRWKKSRLVKLLSTFLLIKKPTHREGWTQEFTLSLHLRACFVIFNSMTASWYLYRKAGYLDYFLLSLNMSMFSISSSFSWKTSRAADAIHESFSNILLCGFVVTSQTKPWVLFPSVQGTLLPKIKQM